MIKFQSLGNHEFDFGAEGLAPLLDSAKFPIVAANLDFSKEPRIVTVKKSVILTVSGEKIGIIGHLTNETIIISNPGLVGFLDVVQSVKEESEKLDQQGIKIIIALGHSGYEMDKRIAAEVPLVDVVIGGHTNTFQWNGPPPDLEVPEDVYPTVITQSSGKKVPVVQAYAFTKYLGRLNVTFNEDGDLIEFEGQPELLETSIPQDGDVLDLLDRYRPEVNALNNKVIGHSKVILDATNMKCRVQECNFGNMVADAFVFYMASLSIGEGWTQYPIGLMNGGSIRTTVDPTKTGGNITRGELFGALPFDSQLVSLQLTGKDLIQTLEIGARGDGETSKGEFLQVSGVHVVYNISQPKYSRVVSVKVRCGQCKIPVYEDVVPDRLYGVATLNFLTRGGDGHFVLKDKAINLRAQDLSDLDVTDWYLQRYSPVYPAEEGRIQFVSDDTVSGSGYSSGSSLKVNRVIVCLILCAFSCFN